MKNSRRAFLQKTALGFAGSVSLPLITSAAHFGAPEYEAENKLPIGFAGYTFARFDVDKSIEMMKRLNVTNLSVKDIHLPINSSDAKIKEVMGKYVAGGINVYAAGVIYMKTKEAVDAAFDYAKKVGVNLIVGVPNYDLIDHTEQKVKETGIRIAIHNHGPEDALYPGPADVMKHIENRDPRMGLCLDIGHATRAGADPAKAVKAFKTRLFDLHIKDVSAKTKDGKAIEMGRGVIDFVSLVKALEKINYKGMCSIEYEKDMSDPMPGMAESIGFFKGILTATT